MANNPTASQIAKDRELLDRLGYGVLDVQTGSGVGFEDVARYSYVVEPDLNPRATALKLQEWLGRPFSEREARAAYQEILRYKLELSKERNEDVSVEEAARLWWEKYGLGFLRRWYLTQPEPGQHRYVPGGRERGPGPVGKATTLAVPELKPLLEAGFSVADVALAAARRPDRAVRYILSRVPSRDRAKYYVRLLARLTGWELSEEEAERTWVQILKHKLFLSEQLGHDVSMERAIVDYFKRLRLAGLDRAALWETGQLFSPDTVNGPEKVEAPSTQPGALFPA